MKNSFELDERYSTTRMVFREVSEFKSWPNEKYSSILFLPVNKERKGEGGLRTGGYFKDSVDEMPLISIVTVVFNDDEYLEETILSVINQEYENVEYIIIDGGSTDNGVEIIKKYEHSIDYWVSEKDKGIYNAMNKGLRLCRGDVIGIINSGDYYTEDCFKIISREFPLTSEVLTGGIFKYSQKLNVGFTTRADKKKLSYVLNYMPVNHPATFVAKSAYKTYGIFNESYKICADNELIARFINAKCQFKFFDDNLAVMRMGGVSEQANTIFLMAKEHYEIRKENDQSFVENINLTLFYIFKRLFKKATYAVFPKSIMRLYYEAKCSKN